MKRRFFQHSRTPETGVRSFEFGGTNTANLDTLANDLDLVTKNAIDQPNGVAAFQNGKIKLTQIPDFPVSEASFPTGLRFKDKFYASNLAVIYITNYDTDKTYTIHSPECEAFRLTRDTTDYIGIIQHLRGEELRKAINLSFLPEANIDIAERYKLQFVHYEMKTGDQFLTLHYNSDNSLIVVKCPETPGDIHLTVNERDLVIPVLPNPIPKPVVLSPANNAVLPPSDRGSNPSTVQLTPVEISSEIFYGTTIFELSETSDFAINLFTEFPAAFRYRTSSDGFSITMDDLLPNKMFYLRARYVTKTCLSPWSDTFSFVTTDWV